MKLTPAPKVKLSTVWSGVLIALPTSEMFAPVDCWFRLHKDTCLLSLVLAGEEGSLPPTLLLRCLLLASMAFLAEFRMASVLRDICLGLNGCCFRTPALGVVNPNGAGEAGDPDDKDRLPATGDWALLFWPLGGTTELGDCCIVFMT